MGQTRTEARLGPLGWMLRILLTLSPLAVVLVLVRLYGLGWGPQHHMSDPQAKLSPALQRALMAQLGDVHDSRDAAQIALALTSDLLHFGFRHRTTLLFDAPRQGNCAEYAALFGTAFNQLAQGAQLSARAHMVQSRPTSLMGFRPQHPALRTHEWVAVVDGDNKRYVDPTLHDAWLGADISRNVHGEPESSRSTATARPPHRPRPERIVHRGAPSAPVSPKPTLPGMPAVQRIFDNLGVAKP